MFSKYRDEKNSYEPRVASTYSREKSSYLQSPKQNELITFANIEEQKQPPQCYRSYERRYDQD